MRCLFCKADSAASRSEEHIIPESLGNTTSILPPGVVCDRCNNYFAREVEKPFMESTALLLLRFRQGVLSKRGVVPPMRGILLPDFPVEIRRDAGGMITMDEFPSLEAVLSHEVKEHLTRVGSGKFVFPAHAPLPSGPTVSRFLAKAALETMAQRVLGHPGGIDYFVDEVQLDPIRDHARRGTQREWAFHVRRIYDESRKWRDSKDNALQVVHESDVLNISTNEWYYVLALFGLEFAINYGGPFVEGYVIWLSQHHGISPLYYGKNADGDLR